MDDQFVKRWDPFNEKDSLQKKKNEEQEEEEEDVKKLKQIKQPNPLNEQKREHEARQKREQDQADQGQGRQYQAQPVQPQSKIPLFGDGGLILTDWTTSHLIDDPIDQYKDTCSSVVFTRLTQASYNKDRHIAPRQNMSYRDLVEYLKGKSKGRKLSFQNLNEPIKYIQNVGLLKDVIYHVPAVITEKCDAHVMFVVAKDMIKAPNGESGSDGADQADQADQAEQKRIK
ncbi:hypothetical protein [Arabidopsis thaliana]|uniref:Uncharacterized protein AT4g03580 n=1 Tax=Arabidopsis thaliana TaxID=3702 RepID=Q9SY36_ARATH|nr:uncharacterized protein AT4G03580 [Arabidopsis thaliana]AAD15314.1 hypothetical protein [Arabidopsis thaliana]AEE82341.1 hypothetical protein AT4G03580 [Arabidopsis thaliana]CAB77843.1 hypothetical protein [Arabidopsis thaliana]|eukprot:NP_192267.1 hypothetical protein AT4G03580 [Arabidopsis thaliana]